MKKILISLMCIVMVVCFMPAMAFAGEEDVTPAYGWYDAEKTEFTLKDAADLLGFANIVNGTAGEGNPAQDNFENKTVKLGADIDLSGIDWTPIGDASDTTKQFMGEFDGQDYAIKNLTQTSGSRMGLFSMPTKAYLHNFTMEKVSFTAKADNTRIGAVAGNLQYWNVVKDININGINVDVNGNDGLIGAVSGYVWKSQLSNVDVNNVTINANGTGNCVGGHTSYARGHIWDENVAANNNHWLNDTTFGENGQVVQNLFAGCDVKDAKLNMTGSGDIAGFIGSDSYNNHSNYFVNCTVDDLEIICGEGGTFTAGGFIASNSGTTDLADQPGLLNDKYASGFNGCSVSGAIKATGASGIYGGFAGSCGGRVHSYADAYAAVNISCSGTAGGFVGETANYFDHTYTFEQCKADGDVTGTVAGGFAGKTGLSVDGMQIYVNFDNCSASGAVTGSEIAGGFIGDIDPELPEQNWNTVQGEGKVSLSGCTASNSVNAEENGKVGGLIGQVQTKPVGDVIEGGSTTEIKINGNKCNTDLPVYVTKDGDTTDNEDITKVIKITFNVTPDNAKITILRDGQTVVSGLAGTYIIEPGDYTYTISRAAYYDKTGSIKVENGDQIINAQLNAVAVYIPTIQRPTIVADANAKVTLSTDGTKATIEAAEGYELADVTLNGVSQGKVTEVKGLKTGDKLVVTVIKTSEEPTKEEILAALADQQLVARSKIVTLKNGKKAIRITWYNSKGDMMEFDGVEIFRSTKKNVFGKKPIFTSETGKYYNTAIKAGTRYYYKVRGYVVIDGEKYYTDWSLKAIRKAR